ncbi:hypothetical protein SAMN05443247_08948 [Bradyrhizobium erythrophlei]|nr:hypothetical protein SAMN05443247_08948 [Bradyrhizobium erythrophlei]
MPRTYHLSPSLRGATGSRECAPDDKLCDEAIHSLSGEMDCFAEPVIGRAFARPVGSQRRSQIIRATAGIRRSITVSPQLSDSVPANTTAAFTAAGHE